MYKHEIGTAILSDQPFVLLRQQATPIVMRNSTDSIADSPCCCQEHIFSERQQLPGLVTDARSTTDRARQRVRLNILNHSYSLSSLSHAGSSESKNAASPAV